MDDEQRVSWAEDIGLVHQVDMAPRTQAVVQRSMFGPRQVVVHPEFVRGLRLAHERAPNEVVRHLLADMLAEFEVQR